MSPSSWSVCTAPNSAMRGTARPSAQPSVAMRSTTRSSWTRMSIWSEYAVRSWPTSFSSAPTGRSSGWSRARVIGILDQAIAGALAAGAAGVSCRAPSSFEARHGSPRDRARVPGRCWPTLAGRWLFIADSNHSRVVVAAPPTRTAIARDAFDRLGIGGAGRRAGRRATFHHPQARADGPHAPRRRHGELHLLRAVDLDTWEVTTVLGTGVVTTGPVERWAVAPLNSAVDLAVEGAPATSRWRDRTRSGAAICRSSSPARLSDGEAHRRRPAGRLPRSRSLGAVARRQLSLLRRQRGERGAAHRSRGGACGDDGGPRALRLRRCGRSYAR